jgi:hypothetical protein
MQVSESEFGALMRSMRTSSTSATGTPIRTPWQRFALQQAFGGSLGVAEDLSRSGKSLADALEWRY